jgi:hypothetical protein
MFTNFLDDCGCPSASSRVGIRIRTGIEPNTTLLDSREHIVRKETLLIRLTLNVFFVCVSFLSARDHVSRSLAGSIFSTSKNITDSAG